MIGRGAAPHSSQASRLLSGQAVGEALLTAQASNSAVAVQRMVMQVQLDVLLLRPAYSSLLTPHHSLLTPHHSLLTTHYLLLTTRYSLLTAHCSLLTTHYSPLTTPFPLLTTHCSLLTTHYHCSQDYPHLQAAHLGQMRALVAAGKHAPTVLNGTAYDTELHTYNTELIPGHMKSPGSSTYCLLPTTYYLLLTRH